jgi:DNA repair protein SbcD/Mre11
MDLSNVKKPRSFRVIHSSDWHLGHELHGFDRGFEHETFLEWLASSLIELEADAVIVTGDVYDTGNPAIPAQQRLYQFLRKALLGSSHLQIVLIGGNHDSGARLELPKHILDSTRIHLVGGMPRDAGRPAAARTLIKLSDGSGTIRAFCAAIPYLRPGDLPMAGDTESPLKIVYREVIDKASDVRGDLPLIVTGHLHMSGGVVSELSERRIIIGGEEAVSSDIFPPCVSYVALGHLHKPQSIAGQTVIRYAGSPFPMSVAEKDYQHSIVVIDFDEMNEMKTCLMSIPRPVAFQRVPTVGAAALNLVEDELRLINIDDPGDHRRPFLEVAVKLEGAEPDLRRRIDAALEGKPVRLTRIIRQIAGAEGTLADAVGEMAALDELDPAHVFARRHIDEFGVDPPNDLKNAFNEVLIGVLSPSEDLEVCR